MRYILTLLLACLFLLPSTAAACVHSLTATDTYVEVCTAPDACRMLLYADLGFGNNHTKRAEAIRDNFQAFLDVRLELNTMPPDDPAKAEDPDCENFFWGDHKGDQAEALNATHLIARSCVVQDVEWTGTVYYFTVYEANRCP